MKISSLVVVFLMFCTMPGLAQETIKPDKRLKGGIVSSRLANTEWESSASPGFAIGLSLDFRFTQLFSVQPEVLYVEKGGREKVPSLNTEFNLTLDYIEVPVIAKFYLPTNTILQPHAYVGPYASFLIENNSNIELIDNEQLTPDKVVEDANRSDFGAVIGIGTDFNFAFNTMSAEIRYSAGFSDVFSGAASQSSRTGTLMFLIGFRF